MPDATIEHDTIEDARAAKAEPVVGELPPEEPEKGEIQLKREAMRDKSPLAEDEPWLSIWNDELWTVIT